MNGVHVVFHGVDNYQHISKLSGNYPPTVVSGMLRPNNVDLVITQMSQLKVEGEQKKINTGINISHFFLTA